MKSRKEATAIYSDWLDFEDLPGMADAEAQLSRAVAWARMEMARKPSGILVVGPTSSGKTMVARRITQEMGFTNDQVHKINAAMLANNPELAYGELFGWKKGAFTSSDKDRQGILHSGHKSQVVIIDEFETLPDSVQANLLVYLDDGTFTRLGDGDIYQSKKLIIALTNVPPEEKKDFRADLLARFRRIDVPPLDDRPLDIINFMDAFRLKHNLKRRFTIAEVALFLLHEWKGGIRELEQAVFDLAFDGKLPTFKEENKIWRKCSLLYGDNLKKGRFFTFEDSFIMRYELMHYSKLFRLPSSGIDLKTLNLGDIASLLFLTKGCLIDNWKACCVYTYDSDTALKMAGMAIYGEIRDDLLAIFNHIVERGLDSLSKYIDHSEQLSKAFDNIRHDLSEYQLPPVMIVKAFEWLLDSGHFDKWEWERPLSKAIHRILSLYDHFSHVGDMLKDEISDEPRNLDALQDLYSDRGFYYKINLERHWEECKADLEYHYLDYHINIQHKKGKRLLNAVGMSKPWLDKLKKKHGFVHPKTPKKK